MIDEYGISEFGVVIMARENRLPPAIAERIEWHRQHRAAEVDLSALDLHNSATFRLALSEMADLLPGIQILDLGFTELTDDGLTALASAITRSELGQLEQLELGNTRIGDPGLKALAEAVGCGQLTRLWHLDLSRTDVGDDGLKALADVAADGQLLRLLHLHLVDTKIGDDGLVAVAKAARRGGLEQLRCLELEFTAIGDEGLKALAEAARCGALTELKYLNLKWTAIGEDGLKALADAAGRGQLARLEQLEIWNTRAALAEAVASSRNASEIFRAIREQQQEDSRPLHEVKLLLIGQGETGKTHLRKRLFAGERSKPDYYDRQEDRTHSVDCERHFTTVVGTDGNRPPWLYRVWDFGGQPHLHGAHSFFLGSDHCVYVLVLDATRNSRDNRLDYWLRFVAHHGRNPLNDAEGNPQRAPVLIVLNKCDFVALAQQKDCPQLKSGGHILEPATVTANHQELRRELERAAASDWYTAHVIGEPIEGLGLSDESERHRLGKEIRRTHEAALGTVRDVVREATDRVVGRQLRFAAGFFQLKEWLEEQFTSEDAPVTWINYRSPVFAEAFALCHVANDGQQIDYLKRLRDLGVAHWVGDVPEIAAGTETEVLQGVFNPAWVKEPVYRLLQTKGQDDHGWIQLGSLVQRLANWTTREQNAIRRLMVACGVAFEVMDKSLPNGLLIPDLLEPLPEEQLESWAGDEVLRAEIRLPYLPERVFLRYVATHYTVIKVPRQKHCWRNEIVLLCAGLDEHCEVLIQSHVCPGMGEMPYVGISIRGGTGVDREVALRMVRRDFNQIVEREGLTRLQGDGLVKKDPDEITAKPSGGPGMSAIEIQDDKPILDEVNHKVCWRGKESSFQTGRGHEVAACWKIVRYFFSIGSGKEVGFHDIKRDIGGSITHEAIRKQIDKANDLLKAGFEERIRIQKNGTKTAMLVVS